MTQTQLSKDEIRIGRAVKEYRKVGLNWCKLERMFKMSHVDLKNIVSRYEAYLINNE